MTYAPVRSLLSAALLSLASGAWSQAAPPEQLRFAPAAVADVPTALATISAQLARTGAAASPGAGPGDAVGFDAVEVREGRSGYRHHRYRQRGPGGYPIEGAIVTVHEPPAGAAPRSAPPLTATSSAVPADRFLASAGVAVTAAEARARAEAALPAPAYVPAAELAPTTLTWVADASAGKPGRYRLAHRVDVYALSPRAREFVYVDAASGEIVSRRSRLSHTEEPATLHTRYHGTREAHTERTDDGGFRLYQEATRGTVIHTRDLRNGTQAWVDFLDDDNDWSGANPAQDEAARDAFWGSTQFYDVLSERLGRRSIDDAGHPLITHVHYGSSVGNAFWDGEAAFFGDGDAYSPLTYPTTAVDIVAHEFAHGLIQYSAGLIYRNESGALNESFADIYGVSVRHFADSTRHGDFSIGTDVDAAGAGIRSMSDPKAFGHPDTYDGEHYYTGDLDRGGVHINSGVQNYWYYLLCEGDAGTNDHGHAYDVAAIGMPDALLLVHETLTAYLTPDSDYAAAAAGSLAAAEALFGACDARTASVAAAWAAVGLPVAPAADTFALTVSPSVTCDPARALTLSALAPYGGEVYWRYDGGGADTGRVVRRAFPIGEHGVSATWVGCDGSRLEASLPGGVTVDPEAITCREHLLPTDGSTLALADCGGTLLDPGGRDGDYADQTFGSVLVTAPAASTAGYLLTVESFLTEVGYDFLEVYAVDGERERLLRRASGTDLVPGDTLRVGGPAFRVSFLADYSVTAPGFAIAYEVVGGADTASAAVQVADPEAATVFAPVSFGSEGSVGGLTYDFGDGSPAEAFAPGAVATHAYAAAGTYVVRQLATTCANTDTAEVTVAIGPGSLACADVDTVYLSPESPDARLEVPVAVENCGARDLYLGPAGFLHERRLVSRRPYYYAGSRTDHSFTSAEFDAGRDAVTGFNVGFAGDFDAENELVQVTVGLEGRYLDTALTGGDDYVVGTWSRHEFPWTRALTDGLGGGGVYLSTDNTYAVGANPGETNAHEVVLTLARRSETRLASVDTVVAPGESAVVALVVDVAEYTAGTYHLSLPLQTNDTTRPGGRLLQPVVLTVPTSARARFPEDTLDFGVVYTGSTQTEYLRLYNDGTEALSVDSAVLTPEAFALYDPVAGLTIPPGESRIFYLTAAPLSSGRTTGTLRVHYNGSRAIELPLVVIGEAAGAPAFGPDRLDTVSTQAVFRDSVWLYNRGAGEMTVRTRVYDYSCRATVQPDESESTVAPGDSLLHTYEISFADYPYDGSSEVVIRANQYAPYAEARFAHRFVRRSPPRGTVAVEDTICGTRARFRFENQYGDLDREATAVWDFGDGGAATGLDVVHEYGSPGDYVVAVEACNAVGCTRDTARVYVDATCTDIRLDGTQPETVTSCAGLITDSGGPSGRYDNGERYGVHLAPGVGQVVQLTREGFATESCCDRLVVYAGDGATGEVLATWRGVLSDTAVVYSGAAGLYLSWRSDGSVTRDGFRLRFACVSADALRLTAVEDQDCPGTFDLAASAPVGATVTWDLGDGSAAEGMQLRHVYTRIGTHTLRAVAAGPDGYRDSTTLQLPVRARPASSDLHVLVVGDSTLGATLSFATAGMLTDGYELTWGSSEGHDGRGPLTQLTFATAGEHWVEVRGEHPSPWWRCPIRARRPVTIAAASAASTPRGADLGFSLGPNPTGAATVVRLATAPTPGTRLRLVDALGRVVYDRPLRASPVTLPTAGLSAGVYRVSVERPDGHQAGRLLVVR